MIKDILHIGCKEIVHNKEIIPVVHFSMFKDFNELTVVFCSVDQKIMYKKVIRIYGRQFTNMILRSLRLLLSVVVSSQVLCAVVGTTIQKERR